MKSMKFLSAFAVAAFAATAALAAPSVTSVDTAKGKVLAGEKGKSLYTFRNDKKDVSNCYGDCEKNWPPLFAEASAKAGHGYSIVTRKDGKKQWAKDGMPLYYWVKDMKQGDVTGDGVLGVWDLARP
ncbi:hypothetical protein ABK249_08320 [Neorhizobium sp. Rsf11]|uniref:Lipoprotein n=2 Tax=Neorhizobium TaxID=1525371 RepID=A0ABV0LZA8_9HYPH|nr:hypothetical protein [Neorhizobium petrolearium]MCC2610912.1 hypothetical protein [Neorhizobium petrolearium]WGI71026.1 hypothetical protein QEO92_13750 [Neorhizobium petrolearium]